MELTEGTLLGGRVRYAQPAAGFRSGIEPVLLAASVPARPGQVVLEAGTGAGAATLCLLARVPGLRALAIEADPAMAALARHNAAANGWALEVTAGDVAGAPARTVDHAFANPPWHGPGTLPPDPLRRRAMRLDGVGLAGWVEPLARALRGRGTLTLALPARLVAGAVAASLAAGLGEVALCPLWPRAGVAAKLALLRARRGPAAMRIGPGLVLHAGGGYSAAADAVLRGGEPLTW
jgi:tRNA1Val (adenine37-N6)-methyltransferase